jgi:hypothetical protein
VVLEEKKFRGRIRSAYLVFAKISDLMLMLLVNNFDGMSLDLGK